MRPAPLPAGRLGRAAAWTSLQAQRGPLWGSRPPELAASTRASWRLCPLLCAWGRSGERRGKDRFSGACFRTREKGKEWRWKKGTKTEGLKPERV